MALLKKPIFEQNLKILQADFVRCGKAEINRRAVDRASRLVHLGQIIVRGVQGTQ